MQAFLEEKRAQIAELCRTHHVRRLSVFGSAVRDDFDSNRSDVDLLVEFDYPDVAGYANNKWSFEEEVVKLFCRKVDLVTEGSIRNPYILASVDQDRELLYAA